MNNRISRRLYIVCFSIIVSITYLGVLAAPVTAAATMTVVSRTPTLNQMDVAADFNVVVTFNTTINNATVNSSTFNVDGSLSGRIAGAYNISETIVTFNPDANFKAGETVTVTLTTGIQSTLGNTLIAPVTWQFMVKVPGGTATFPSGINFGTGSDKTTSVVLGDIDGDGDLDIVVGNDGGPNMVYLNNGSGTTWTGVNFGTGNDNTRSLALGDVDGDGDLDIVVGNRNQQSLVYLNNGNGTTWTGVNFGPVNDDTCSVALGDVDGDDDLDIVAGNNGGQNVVYKNDGTGTTWTGVNFGTGSDATTSVVLGDVDGDGDLDIVTGNYEGQQNIVYKNDGTGTTWTGVNFGIGGTAWSSVVLGDVDGDGDLDIVAGNYWDQSKVYKNDGTGTTWTGVNFGPGNDRTISLALGDVDGDGDLDIIVGNEGQQNKVYRNDGSGVGITWTGVNFGTGSDYTFSVAIGDVDGDGDLDIVAGNYDQQNKVYKNTSPEMNIEGNSTEIFSGDATPSNSDYTDFGSTAVIGGTVDRTYTIKNAGDAALFLSGTPKVSLGGTNATDFSVTIQPSSPVAISGNTTFTVRFDPSASGLRTAIVSIANNDSNENPYVFAIQGTGTTVSVTTSSPLPNGEVSVAYSQTLAASGGTEPYIWSIQSGTLPAGLSLNSSGVIMGIPVISGNFTATISVTDSFVPADTASKTFSLKIFLRGDANGDGVVTIGDVTKAERIILGLEPPTPGADANKDGHISIADVTKIERLILGLDPSGPTFTYSGVGQGNTPPFAVSSSPWKLSYTVDWSGNFAITVKGNLVVNQGVAAGQTYETYIYDTTGALYLSVVSASASGHWTISVEANPSIPAPNPGTTFTYSGVGQGNTPPFAVSSSPWKLSYTVDWSGNFAITVKGNLVVNQGVAAGQTYETYIYDTTGALYLSVVSASASGHWTISVMSGS